MARNKSRLRYSCEGVLLFTVEYSPRTYAIFNPITQEKYSIYSVRAQTWKRKIICPTPNLLPNVSPAIVNGAVHLLVARDLEKLDIPPCIKGTMVLNMDKEEFSNMPRGKYIKRCLF
ncbi:hypothetical protein KY285_023790 [Solanum tuberosum]|nr:hypothetical protein KY285_023790 [Solanum tuberosum]